jgi:hypothetical protein
MIAEKKELVEIQEIDIEDYRTYCKHLKLWYGGGRKDR